MKLWKIWIDTGGTFTDCIAHSPSGSSRYIKVLSNSSLRGTFRQQLSATELQIREHWQAADNFVKGLQLRSLQKQDVEYDIAAYDAARSLLRLSKPLPENTFREGESLEISSPEEAPVLACRLATHTVPGEKLPPVELRLATTRGTNALLEKKGAPTLLLITKGYGDYLQIGDQKRPDLFTLNVRKPAPLYTRAIEVEERLNAEGNILKQLKTDPLEEEIAAFLERENASFALCLMHSYKNDRHERLLSHWLREQGAAFVSCSADMSPSIKFLPRAQTTVTNAYLAPVFHRYLRSVASALPDSRMYVMNSAAGLVTGRHFKPKDSLLSGPAGGVIGAATAGRETGETRIISLDMGGTSTDVARYDGEFDYQFEHTVGNATIKAPALAVETVAAGGGSICSFDGQKLTVGPDSAGAYPGPACYGAGGPLTLTDVNLLLGRLRPDNFNIPVSIKDAGEALAGLMQTMRQAGPALSEGETLEGLLRIANERMAEAITRVSLRKGYDPSDYSLVAFGGAGAQHAAAIAALLNIKRIIIPAKAGLLSAYGLGNASIEKFVERQLLQLWERVQKQLPQILAELETKAREKLSEEIRNTAASAVIIRRRLVFMRLKGQESTLEIEFRDISKLKEDFIRAYRNRYGHWMEGRAVEIESVRVIAATKNEVKKAGSVRNIPAPPEADSVAKVRFSATDHTTTIFDRTKLQAGQRIEGPSVILDPYSTTVVDPGWRATVQQTGALELLKRHPKPCPRPDNYGESINLELFTNRFTSIAEEMGEMMRRTALSVNIKERLDFSCALLSPEGRLVVNAPHIPVHLGALGLCVRKLKKEMRMREGDVVITNHPRYGGSHLPDITVLTPVFDGRHRLLGYAACRAHHAEIGGSRPGSMPPDARTLEEEGVVIPPTYLLKSGEGQWPEIEKLLSESRYPSRAIQENLADIRAALAANHLGNRSLKQLAKRHGTGEIHRYMKALTHYTARICRQTLQNLPEISTRATEYLDDGSILTAKLGKAGDQLTIDFSGSAEVHPGNLNATPAIVQSVAMYVLRCLIDRNIPLNEGLLDPVNIILPGGILNPGFEADPQNCPAVVGGNTETSQRLVDLLFKPFEKAACSQGTMNNVIFGNENFGYYETIGGGTGAGPGFDGAHAVHHHMTNTAGTDPEILEHRYPVRLERYAIRPDSGGEGAGTGGNGIIRELTFLQSVSLSVLTQHRRESPYGLRGGKAGRRGKQFISRKNEARESLASIDGAELEAGDRFTICTPGGGGFGKKRD